ncbi:two-component response regulator ORR24-like [Phoenix dactylifera]|uniref:Two-component response regulator ORR24-like n=1 Tax=Phoenix dactylifera TaxID=42345 RepID=A0A8B8J3M3_PHODC|nr:two-component response regulator ORR24-like [Phoenix dactylifera]
MSIDATMEVMMKGIREGACYFLPKPMSIDLVRNLWIHVIWKKFSDEKEIKRLRRESEKGKAPLVSDSRAPDDRAACKVITIDDHGSYKAKMKQVLEQEDDPATPKKPRVIWTPELNRKFEGAIAYLGIEQAIPSKIAELMNVEGIDRHHVGSHLQKYRIRLRQEKERQEACVYWNQFHCTINPSYQAGYMLVPQAATYPTGVNVPGAGNAVFGSFSGSVQPQQVGGCAQQHYNTNCFPNTAFGATGAGMNAQTFSSNPAQNIREENTVSMTEFAAFNNNFQAPGTSTPGYHAADGLAPSGLLMDSIQPLPTNMGQENPGVHEAASSSMPIEDGDIEKFIEELLKED